MTLNLYSHHEPRDAAVERGRCEWAVRVSTLQWRQCWFKPFRMVEGHWLCVRHGRKARV